MSVIERAEQRLNDEIRQHELGLDNVDDIQYWAAYLDGARAQKKDAAAAIEDMAKHITEMHERVTVLQIARGELEAEVKRLEPKRGEWVGVSPTVDTVQCSICGGQIFSAELETPYCPYCGAKMIGEQNVE